MDDKSYVTLERCIICKQDTGSLMLDRRLRNTFEMHTTFPTSVCDACKEKYLKKGVMLVNPETGSLVVLKRSAFIRMFGLGKINKSHIVFAHESLLNELQRSAGV
jgi:hypothetical protein